jgi:hypothetical protein
LAAILERLTPKNAPRIGRFALLAAGAALAFAGGWVWMRRQHSARFRRAALTELQALAKRMESSEARPEALAALPSLVGDVCANFASPEQLRDLSGQEWLDLLDSTWPGGSFSNGPGRILPTLSYSNRAGLSAVSREQALELVELLRRWIRGHRKPLQRIARAESRS